MYLFIETHLSERQAPSEMGQFESERIEQLICTLYLASQLCIINCLLCLRHRGGYLLLSRLLSIEIEQLIIVMKDILFLPIVV